MNTDIMDWDSVYRGVRRFRGPATVEHRRTPTRAGRRSLRPGKVRGDVLDGLLRACRVPVGLPWRPRGTRWSGIELTPTAVREPLFAQAAKERNLPNATFVRTTSRRSPGSDGRFNTIIDSTLSSTRCPLSPGTPTSSRCCAPPHPVRCTTSWSFAKGGVPRPNSSRSRTRGVDEAELHAKRSASTGRSTRSGRRSSTPTRSSSRTRRSKMPAHDQDDKGRIKFPRVPVDGPQGLDGQRGRSPTP